MYSFVILSWFDSVLHPVPPRHCLDFTVPFLVSSLFGHYCTLFDLVIAWAVPPFVWSLYQQTFPVSLKERHMLLAKLQPKTDKTIESRDDIRVPCTRIVNQLKKQVSTLICCGDLAWVEKGRSFVHLYVVVFFTRLLCCAGSEICCVVLSNFKGAVSSAHPMFCEIHVCRIPEQLFPTLFLMYPLPPP